MFSLCRLAVRAFPLPLTPISARSRSITTLISSASHLNRPTLIIPSLRRRFASANPQYSENAPGFAEGETSAADYSSSASAGGFSDQSAYATDRVMSHPGLPSVTLYVGNIFFDTDRDALQRHFEKAGEVVETKVIKDQRGMSKGFGYVEFKDVESAGKAIEMFHQQQLDGRRLNVQYTNRSPNAPKTRPSGVINPPTATLFIGNLSFDVTDRDLNNLFSKWPKCTDVRVAVDRRTGQSRGFAHVDFIDVDSATNAMNELKGMEFYGRALRLDYSEHATGYRAGNKSTGRSPGHVSSGDSE